MLDKKENKSKDTSSPHGEEGGSSFEPTGIPFSPQKK